MDPLLRAIAEDSGLGICVLAPDRQLVFYSARCASMTHREPETLACYEDLLEVTYLEDDEGDLELEIGTELAARVRELEPRRRSLFDLTLPELYEGWLRPESGELRRLEVRRRTLADGSVLWILRDTTEQRQIEAAYQQKQRELDRALFDLKRSQAYLVQSEKLATVGQLAAGIAHELNTPLNTILGYAQLLRRQLPTEELRAEIDAIEKASRRCRKTVKDMLSFTRKSSGTFEAQPLNKVVRGVVSLLQHDFLTRGIELRLKLGSDDPQVVMDANRLEQIFVILAQNAAQAMPEGGTLSVESRVHGANVEVLVRDNGQGIAGENLPHIFEPFFTTKEPGEGTGLGLYIAYQIAVQHKGDIKVWSRPEVGSEFLVRLPLA